MIVNSSIYFVFFVNPWLVKIKMYIFKTDLGRVYSVKLIVFKKDIANFLINFNLISNFDEQGKKEYFVFDDGKRRGKWTIMFYRDEDKWTIHGMGEHYCDEGERTMTKAELTDFIYRNRKSVNNSIRELRAS